MVQKSATDKNTVQIIKVNMLKAISFLLSFVFKPVPPRTVRLVSSDYAHNQRVPHYVFIR